MRILRPPEARRSSARPAAGGRPLGSRPGVPENVRIGFALCSRNSIGDLLRRLLQVGIHRDRSIQDRARISVL
jgi:hypothetical protein